MDGRSGSSSSGPDRDPDRSVIASLYLVPFPPVLFSHENLCVHRMKRTEDVEYEGRTCEIKLPHA